MCAERVIQLENVGKAYQSYAKPIQRLRQALRKHSHTPDDAFWALRDIDLVVEAGETLGIIGKNGCGKSTLLQTIVGTIVPTTGSVSTKGRLSAILELGAGFNPEFTGVENAKLNASIIGMSGTEIEHRLVDIVDFSGLGAFIEQPVKTYSSGMYIRLAFSICITMQPEILIIDEALAVGDARFQRKCFRKIEELRNSGTTILFVTHATDSVIALCNRALLLDAGQIKAMGEPKLVVNQYLESVFIGGDSSSHSHRPNSKGAFKQGVPLNTNGDIDGCLMRATYNPSEYRWGNRAVSIVDYLLTDADGEEIVNGCTEGDRLKLSAAVYFHEDFDDVIYGFTVKTIDGGLVFGTNSLLKQVNIGKKRAHEHAIIDIGFTAQLGPGDYFISLGIVQQAPGPEIVLDRRYDLFLLNVNTENQSSFGVAALDVSMEHKE